jgi:hypothetical protein
VGIGGAGVGGALEVDGIGLGLGFADRSKVRPKGDIEGDWVDLGVNVGVNVDALGLSAGVVETVASRLGSVAFVGSPLTGGKIVVPIYPVSRVFDGGEGGLRFVTSNTKLEVIVS